MTAKKKNVGGRPTRAEKREQQLTDAFETMAKVMEQQQETLEWLKQKLQGDEAHREQARHLDPADEFANVAKPAPVGEPGVIYKSGSRGLRQVLRKSSKIHTGDDYEIVPPVVADFENSTFRTSDPEIIAMLDAKIEFREKRGLPPRIVKIKDERIAEALAKPETDVKPVGDGLEKHPEIPDWALPPTEGTA